MKCIDCEFYEKHEDYYGFGKCGKIIDANTVDILFEHEAGEQVDNRFIYTWGLESCVSGAYVGENFGCVHFKEIEDLKAQKYRQDQAEIECLEKAKLEIEAMLNKKG